MACPSDDNTPRFFSGVVRLVAVLNRIALLGLGPSRRFDAAKFTATEAHEIEAGIADAKSIVAGARIEKPLNGWRYPSPDLGDFGQNYLFRAQVAITGLAALPRQEAMYMRAVAADGGFNFRDGTWRLNLAPDQLPPVDASLNRSFLPSAGRRCSLPVSTFRTTYGTTCGMWCRHVVPGVGLLKSFNGLSHPCQGGLTGVLLFEICQRGLP
jgi:hypothetical protein